MGLEEVKGIKGARKEKKKQTMSSIWYGKVRMGHSKPKVMKVKKVRG